VNVATGAELTPFEKASLAVGGAFLALWLLTLVLAMHRARPRSHRLSRFRPPWWFHSRYGKWIASPRTARLRAFGRRPAPRAACAVRAASTHRTVIADHAPRRTGPRTTDTWTAVARAVPERGAS
jgi:hypothetical protein